MRRKIRKVDMSEFSDDDDIETAQDEEIQYRSGRLQRSSGNASFYLVNDTSSDPDLNPMSLSQAFAATGSYKMELKACHKINKYAYGVQKKRIMSEMKQSPKEDLKAIINKSM